MTSSLHTLKRARQVIQFSRTFQNENSPILSIFTSFNKLTRVSTSNIYHLMSESSSYECNILYFAIKWTYIMKFFLQETDYGRQKRKPRRITVFSRHSSIHVCLWSVYTGIFFLLRTSEEQVDSNTIVFFYSKL